MYIQNADDNGNLQTNIFVDAFGFVGVGTTAPASNLDVGGQIKAASIKLTSPNGTEYVVTVDNAGNLIVT